MRLLQVCCELSKDEFSGSCIPASPGIEPGSDLHLLGRFRRNNASKLRDPRWIYRVLYLQL